MKVGEFWISIKRHHALGGAAYKFALITKKLSDDNWEINYSNQDDTTEETCKYEWEYLKENTLIIAEVSGKFIYENFERKYESG